MPSSGEIHKQFEAYRQQRTRVGLVSGTLLVAGVVGLLKGMTDSLWPAACLRIGLVFFMLWLCFPSRRRPAAWSVIKPLPLGIIAFIMWFLPRLKPVLPLIAVAVAALLILRPRRKRR